MGFFTHKHKIPLAPFIKGGIDVGNDELLALFIKGGKTWVINGIPGDASILNCAIHFGLRLHRP